MFKKGANSTNTHELGFRVLVNLVKSREYIFHHILREHFDLENLTKMLERFVDVCFVYKN